MRGLLKKISFALIACFIIVFALQADAADLDDLYKRRDQLSDQLEKAESSSKAKQQEIRSLTQQISSLENDIKATESKITQTTDQISSTESEIKNLDSQIKQKTNELNELKKKINASIVEIYRFSSRSDWELVLSSSSLGESSNQAKYVEAIQIQVKSMYDKLLKLKEALDSEKSKQEAKREELNNLRQRQEEYKKGAEYQVAQKDKLKNMTEQQKEEYERMAEKIRQEVAYISDEILRNRQAASDQYLGGGSGYNYSCGGVDQWGFYTCQCTSYAAWYWNVVLGKRWERGPGIEGTGDAKNWPNLASYNGVGVHSSPQPGAIISWPGDDVYIPKKYGHVAIVEKIHSDGQITISEYNWKPLSFSRRKINPGQYGSYSYIY